MKRSKGRGIWPCSIFPKKPPFKNCYLCWIQTDPTEMLTARPISGLPENQIRIPLFHQCRDRYRIVEVIVIDDIPANPTPQPPWSLHTDGIRKRGFTRVFSRSEEHTSELQSRE